LFLSTAIKTDRKILIATTLQKDEKHIFEFNEQWRSPINNRDGY
jgi:hypothetical protein